MELPGGQKFFTLARTVPPLWSAVSKETTEFAVALGCELHHARDIIYADQIDTGKPKNLEPIGIGCAACERMDCTQRAHPPIGHELRFDGHMRRAGIFDLDIN